MNDAKPARNASGMRPATALGLVARELFVDSALEVGIERLAAGRWRSAPPAPAPRRRAEHDRTGEHSRERQEPREQVEPVRRRTRYDGRPERRNELVLDLRTRVTGGDAPTDERLHPKRDRRARLVQRRVASRADHLALELALRRMRLARERRRGAEEQRGDRYE